MDWYKKTVEQTAGELNTNIEKGLSKKETNKRLSEYGPNKITEKKGRSALGLLLEQFNDVIIWILFGAVIIAGIKGDVIDAVAILTILTVNAFIGFIQTHKAEKALEALKKMAAPKAMALREKPIEIDAAKLVPGDILLLESGDKIPADCRLIESVNLSINESALTGESTSVLKTIETIEKAESLGDQKNIIFTGTTVVRGRGKAIVVNTGEKTEFGKIARLVQKPDEKTPLQIELKKTGFIIAIVVIAISLIVFIAGWFKGYDITLMLLASVSLAVAAVPEGLPAIITVTLALGVQNMAKKHSVVRRLHAVETLGSTNYICTDKTGTITLNKMEVKKIFINNRLFDFNQVKDAASLEKENFSLLMKVAALANDVLVSEGDKFTGDPTEVALVEIAMKSGFSKRVLEEECPRIDEIPFESERKMMTSVNKESGGIKDFSKGATEVILKKCVKTMSDGEIKELSENEREKLIKASEDLASQGYRVLAFSFSDLKENYNIKTTEQDMTFIGLSAMIDPPRPEVKESIQEAMKAGIKISMITGDHVNTATSIANEVGLLNGRSVISGEKLAKMDVNELTQIVEEVGVYARVNPIDKLKIVEALKKRGHIVAMTGDGVNDAPALKKADIGVSMGITGTDVAKESSDMILTDDNFTTIISAVYEGRVVYDNLKKFINFLLSINVSIVAALFVGIIIMPTVAIPLLPVQILWINLITNGLPALALGIDPPSSGIMERKPRSEDEDILAKNSRKKIIIEGVILSIGALIVFVLGVFWLQLELIKIQTLLFTALVIFQLVHSFNHRFFDKSIFSKKIFQNRFLNYAVIGSLALQLIIIYVPALNPIFKTTTLNGLEWLLIIIVLVVVTIVNDRIKIALA